MLAGFLHRGPQHLLYGNLLHFQRNYHTVGTVLSKVTDVPCGKQETRYASGCDARSSSYKVGHPPLTLADSIN